MARKSKEKTARRSSDGILDEDHPDWLATQEIFAEARGETRRFMWLATIPVLLLLATVVGVFLLARSDDSTETGDEVAGPSADEDEPAINSQETESAAADPAEDTSADGGAEGEGGTDETGGTDESGGTGGTDDQNVMMVLPTPPTNAPYVDATLTDNVFVLSGVVPSDDIKAALEARAELAYAPFASSELQVDEAVGGADWLVAAPEVVGLLPMITDGTIRLQEDSVTLAGRSPNPDYAAGFQAAVGQITGLPVRADGIEITDLEPPRFEATVNNGTVTLAGEIPSETLVETFIQGAAAVYGPDNVTSTMTVDEGTYTSFWNYTMPGIFQTFAPFPVYTIKVEDGNTSGSMQGGILFELNSSEISPEATEVLGIAVAVLSRDRGMTMEVIGHTDDRGADDLNQRLSLARAQSVIDFLAAQGIDPARLSADGRGPNEPIAPNDTDEGRALNRRVEFLFD